MNYSWKSINRCNKKYDAGNLLKEYKYERNTPERIKISTLLNILVYSCQINKQWHI